MITPNSLDEAKELIRKHANEGITCPCCNRFTKVYKRAITSSMAWALIMFYGEAKKIAKNINANTIDCYIHVENFFKASSCPASIRGDFTKLKYWGIIACSEQHKGCYTLTRKGVQFVFGELSIPSYVLVYDDKIYGVSESLVSIKKCLKNKFSYEKIMEDIGEAEIKSIV
jgi:hypothetical protein